MLPRLVSLGDLLLQLLFLLHFGIADQPKYDPKSERRSGKRRNGAWRGLIEIENDESANQGEQRDQDNGAHLDDGAAMMFDDQQGVFEFKRDEHREHHAKEALKGLRIARIDHVASDKPECMQQQLPGSDRHDNCDHQSEEGNDCLLESLIERKGLPFGSQILEFRCESKYFVRHGPPQGLL